MPLTCFHDKSGMIKIKDPEVDLIQFSLSFGTDPARMVQRGPYILSDGAVFLWHFVPPLLPPHDDFPSHLERLAFGEDGFPKGGGGRTSAE